MHTPNGMILDFKALGEPGVRAEFGYHMTPAAISITGKGRLSVGKDLEAVLRKIEYWHQVSLPLRVGRIARGQLLYDEI